jgi:hypothetical protein
MTIGRGRLDAEGDVDEIAGADHDAQRLDEEVGQRRLI